MSFSKSGVLVAVVCFWAACAAGAEPGLLTNVSGASYRGPDAAPGSIVAAFGDNLAASTQSATGSELPLSIGGVSIRITDATGVDRKAGIFFVSPQQINYLVPDDVAEGSAVVIAENAGKEISRGVLTVRRCAPGLLSANADGRGAAAAVALRISPDGRQTPVAVYRYDNSLKAVTTAAISFGAAGDRLFLSLYGTGIRHAKTVTATIAGEEVPVLWSGAQPVYVGLDQVNVEIPQRLADHGPADVILTADGIVSNAVKIEIVRAAFLNLDFEKGTNQALSAWGSSGSGYEFALDTTVKTRGAQSFRIRKQSGGSAFGTASQALPLDIVRGHHVKVTASIKTAGVTPGLAELWARVDGASGTLGFVDMYTNGPRDTTDWNRYSIEGDVSPNAVVVYLGVLLDGNGTAWFDDIAIEVDGVPLSDAPEPLGAPAARQTDWVRQAAYPFTTAKAGSGFDDLAHVKDIVGDARIVALGEGTHGTHEFFQMKHRLVEYLATNMGFTIFAIEANMPEAYLVNDYVLNGKGDPRQLLRGMYFWTWNTQEVLDMIEWMRQFNASGKGRIQFTGFDVQFGTGAMNNVLDFLRKAEPGYVSTAEAAFSKAMAASGNPAQNPQLVAEAAVAVLKIREYMEGRRSTYVATVPAYDVDWAIQNARIVEQYVNLLDGTSLYRDQCMAANLDWILAHATPQDKIVIWAHNYHVSRTQGSMGWYLGQRHDTDYVVFGQLFHKGEYNAYGTQGLTAYDAVPSYPGTIEYVFHSTGMERFILDLRTTSFSDPASSWVRGGLDVRSIGAVPVQGFSATNRLDLDYDAIVFFEDTTPSVLLR
jgi:erythromycin esterase